ncbi:MAG: toll/interleukin-1 receptor domain-containing protein [Acidimicrobiales bacterium]
MADVFISYAGEDRSTAAALSGALEAAGWSVWWDRELAAGDEFAGVIERELDAAGCVIVLWSHAAARSRWVTAEGQRAFDAEKALPARLDDLTPPLPLSMIQAPALAAWDRTPGAPELDELKAAILGSLDRSELVATAPCALFRCVALGEWGCSAGAHDGIIRVWSLSDGQLLRELTGHADAAMAVAWDGGDILASGSADRTARLWSLNEGRAIHTLVGHGGPVDDVALAGQTLITASSDRTVRWWSTSSGQPFASQATDQPLLSCATDAVGRTVAVGSTTGDVTVFTDGVVDTKLANCHDGAVFAVELSADGSRLLTTGADQLARLWSTATGAMTCTFRGHRGLVFAGALGDDVVVTGSSDGTVRLWDSQTGQQLDQMAGLTGGAAGVDLTDQGTIVATSGRGAVRVVTTSNTDQQWSLRERNG